MEADLKTLSPETPSGTQPEAGKPEADKPETGKAKAGKPRRKHPLLRSLLGLLLKLAVIALAVWAALTWVLGVYRMEGNAMYPAVRDGDLCITYRLEDYFSRDIVAYRDAEGTLRVARVIAREGDTVDADEEGLIINGSHISEEIFYPTEMDGLPFSLPRRLEAGEVFLLNDFRSDRNDSRSFGILSTDALEGKLILLLRRRGF